MSASLSYTDFKITDFEEQNKGLFTKFKEYTTEAAKWAAQPMSAKISGLLEKFTGAVGGALARAAQAITGMSMQSVIVGLLIFTAPAQAALMIKGGNGIAEHAKSAMHGSGAADPSAASYAGFHGQSSGAKLDGGFSMGGVMQNRAPDVWQNLGPSKRP
jgi:hypothetical protein